jgi:hypothetical protein
MMVVIVNWTEELMMRWVGRPDTTAPRTRETAGEIASPRLVGGARRSREAVSDLRRFLALANRFPG